MLPVAVEDDNDIVVTMLLVNRGGETTHWRVECSGVTPGPSLRMVTAAAGQASTSLQSVVSINNKAASHWD